MSERTQNYADWRSVTARSPLQIIGYIGILDLGCMGVFPVTEKKTLKL